MHWEETDPKIINLDMQHPPFLPFEQSRQHGTEPEYSTDANAAETCSTLAQGTWPCVNELFDRIYLPYPAH